MDSILQQITDWLKEMLVEAIMGNLSGLFDSVNNQVGEIASDDQPCFLCGYRIQSTSGGV